MSAESDTCAQAAPFTQRRCKHTFRVGPRLGHRLVYHAIVSTATAATAATPTRLTPDPFGARRRHWPRGKEVVWESAIDDETRLCSGCAHREREAQRQTQCQCRVNVVSVRHADASIVALEPSQHAMREAISMQAGTVSAMWGLNVGQPWISTGSLAGCAVGCAVARACALTDRLDGNMGCMIRRGRLLSW